MIPRPQHPRALRRRRAGSVYLSVLGVSLLLAVIAASACLVGRIQARAGATTNDFAEARIYARAGLELAMNTIYNDPYWRTHLGNGTWYSNKAVGSGSFTVTASDPTDNDVTVGDNNPVILTSTGMKGAARYVTSMRMEVTPRVGSCPKSNCAASAIHRSTAPSSPATRRFRPTDGSP